LNKFLKGEISETKFLTNLAREWASLPSPTTGKSVYADDGVNKSTIDIDSVKEMVRELKGDAPELASTPVDTSDFPSEMKVIQAGIPLPTAEQVASIAVGVKDTVLPGIKSLADAVENLSSGKIDLTPISAIQLIRGVVYPGYTMTTKDFSKSEIAALSSAVDKATAKGRKMITYEDYGSGIKGNNIIQSQSILTTMYDSITNPAKRAALVVGNAKIDRRSDGSVWIVDKYDFHPKDSKKFNTAMSNGEYAAAYDLLKNQSSGTMALELVSAYAIQFGVGEPEPFSIMVKPPTNGETGSETTTARMPVSRPGTTGNSDPAPETSPQPRGRGEEDRPFLPGILNAPDTRG
jgi:hypothetical protein